MSTRAHWGAFKHLDFLSLAVLEQENWNWYPHQHCNMGKLNSTAVLPIASWTTPGVTLLTCTKSMESTLVLVPATPTLHPPPNHIAQPCLFFLLYLMGKEG